MGYNFIEDRQFPPLQKPRKCVLLIRIVFAKALTTLAKGAHNEKSYSKKNRKYRCLSFILFHSTFSFPISPACGSQSSRRSPRQPQVPVVAFNPQNVPPADAIRAAYDNNEAWIENGEIVTNDGLRFRTSDAQTVTYKNLSQPVPIYSTTSLQQMGTTDKRPVYIDTALCNPWQGTCGRLAEGQQVKLYESDYHPLGFGLNAPPDDPRMKAQFVAVNGTFVQAQLIQRGTAINGETYFDFSFTASNVRGDGTDTVTLYAVAPGPDGQKMLYMRQFTVSQVGNVWATHVPMWTGDRFADPSEVTQFHSSRGQGDLVNPLACYNSTVPTSCHSMVTEVAPFFLNAWSQPGAETEHERGIITWGTGTRIPRTKIKPEEGETIVSEYFHPSEPNTYIVLVRTASGGERTIRICYRSLNGVCPKFAAEYYKNNPNDFYLANAVPKGSEAEAALRRSQAIAAARVAARAARIQQMAGRGQAQQAAQAQAKQAAAQAKKAAAQAKKKQKKR